MNRAEIRAAAIAGLREQTVPVRWTIGELNRYIDDGYRDMAERTAAVVRTFNVTLGPGQNYLPLPQLTDSTGTLDVLHPIVAKDNLTNLPIDPTHWTFIDAFDRVWLRTTALRPYFFAFWDWKTLLFYPSYGQGGTAELVCAMIPPGLANDNASPEFPPEYHQALIHYVEWRCIAQNAKGPRFGRANRQYSLYSERMQGLGEWTNERHEGLFTAIYGQKARVPADMWGSQ